MVFTPLRSYVRPPYHLGGTWRTD